MSSIKIIINKKSTKKHKPKYKITFNKWATNLNQIQLAKIIFKKISPYSNDHIFDLICDYLYGNLLSQKSNYDSVITEYKQTFGGIDLDICDDNSDPNYHLTFYTAIGGGSDDSICWWGSLKYLKPPRHICGFNDGNYGLWGKNYVYNNDIGYRPPKPYFTDIGHRFTNSNNTRLVIHFGYTIEFLAKCLGLEIYKDETRIKYSMAKYTRLPFYMDNVDRYKYYKNKLWTVKRIWRNIRNDIQAIIKSTYDSRYKKFTSFMNKKEQKLYDNKIEIITKLCPWVNDWCVC